MDFRRWYLGSRLATEHDHYARISIVDPCFHSGTRVDLSFFDLLSGFFRFILLFFCLESRTDNWLNKAGRLDKLSER